MLEGFGGSLPSDWPSDDRFILLPAAGVAGIARGKGPTYGGYHRPTRLDLGLQFAADQALLSARRDEDAVREAILRAHRYYLPADPQNVSTNATHSTWTVTLAAFSLHHVVVGHVGLCRAYLWTTGALRQLTEDHSLASSAEGGAEFFRYTESRYLGFSDDAEVDTTTAPFSRSDMLLLVSPGVYASLEPAGIAEIIEACGQSLETVIDRLLQASAKKHALGVTAVAVRFAGGT